MRTKGGVTVKMLLDFLYLQKESKDVMSFLTQKFGNISLIESYQSFFRYKVESNVKLSQLFGEMQRNVNKKIMKFNPNSE